jgi:alkanesulfonate monooxygenase SsuD/methylene tetrahydromethanopterin reductase-like flavin-dependent oxidoreductase (luciferase family)
MELGLFVMPNHPPERSPYDGAQWDLQVLQWADELGYKEAWLGEHFTVRWEPSPAPDLLIAQALRETERITLASGAHLLPYHHPAELAHRVAYLDHLARGRYMFGIGAGAFASDAALFGVDRSASRAMTREALEIIVGLWEAEGEFHYEGRHWTVHFWDDDPDLLGLHLKPFQKPHPPIGMAGFSPGSGTLRVAGQLGAIPLSLNLSPTLLASHWQAYEDGARAAGRQADRSRWRVSRDVFVAETDEEALRLVLDGMMGRANREFFLPFFRRAGLDRFLTSDPDQEVTVERLAREVWLVGSPDTVAERLQQQYDAAGGWGVLNVQAWDYADHPEAWRQCLELLVDEVVPRIRPRDPVPAVPDGD